MTLPLLATPGFAAPELIRADFLKLIERPRVPAEAEVRPMPGHDEVTRLHFTFAAEKGERVPGLLFRQSAPGRRPVVIALHGTGSNKESQISLLEDLSRRGFTAVAIDGRYHGERTRTGSGSVEYSEAILRAYRTGEGHPFLFDTVWDVLRLIDYLETRPDVDSKRIGLIGFSKGGMETYLAAAVDPRITVAVPCIGVQSFRWALDHDAWQSRVGTFQFAVDGAAQDRGVAPIDAAFVRSFYDRVAPGVYGEFDGPSMLPLIAPRALLAINGDSDPRTPGPGLMECIDAAKAAYRAAGAQEKFVAYLQENTGHKVKPEALQMAVDWFVRWLRP